MIKIYRETSIDFFDGWSGAEETLETIRNADKIEELDAFLEEIRDAADEMDCDRLESVFNEIEQYRIPEEKSELFRKLKDCADQYDYSGILEFFGQV